MSDLTKLYQEYGEYNILYNQLGLPSPSVDYSWRKTKKIVQDESLTIIENSRSPLAVCDIGCGNGALLIRLSELTAKFNKQISFYGFDLSRPFVEYARSAAKYKGLRNVSFTQFDIEHEKLKQKYDLIISSEVLEHLHNPDQILKKLFQSLQKGGTLVLTTPNSKNLIKYPFKFLKQFVAKHNSTELAKNLTTKEQSFVLAEVEQHLYVYSHADLKKALEMAGFTVVKTPRSSTLFGGPFLDNHPLLLGLTLIFDAIADLFPIPQLGWDSIFVVRKL